MQAGDLDQRVELRRKARTSDGAGGATTSASTYATVWAHVRPLSGRERERAARPEADSDYLVVIRKRSDLKASDTLRWRGRDLNIRFIKDQGPRVAFLEIEAELGAAV